MLQSEIESPTGKSTLVEKIGRALAAGIKPDTDEFFQAIGESAAQNNITPTSHLGLFGPIRDRFSSDVQNLIKRQENAVAIAHGLQAESIKHFNDPRMTDVLKGLGQYREAIPGMPGTPDQMPPPATFNQLGSGSTVTQTRPPLQMPVSMAQGMNSPFEASPFDQQFQRGVPPLQPPSSIPQIGIRPPQGMPPGEALTGTIQPPLPGTPGTPGQPATLFGNAITDPRQLTALQQQRIDPAHASALIANVMHNREVEKNKLADPTTMAKRAVLAQAVEQGDWNEVRRIADTLEKEKADKDDVAKFRESLRLAGVVEGSLDAQAKWKEYVDKQSQHPPAASMKVEVKTGESLAKEIGPMMAESRAAALGSLETVDAATRIGQAIEKGQVTLGPLATMRNKTAQFMQVLGAIGKDTQEQLVNTRNVIRGLAQFAVAARKALKGQGQVSDWEGKLIQRAESGEIDDFTLPELKDFIAVTERLSRRQYTQHQYNLDKMRSREDLKGVAPFYEVPDMPPSVMRGEGQSPSLKPWEKYRK